MKAIYSLCLVFLLAQGCSRHVVIEPETVSKQNDSDWIIKSSPR